jgi:3-hydroxypropanoate dehydrogenase
MSDHLSDDALDLIFRDARTHGAWDDRPVEDDDLRRIYDLAKMGPTSANGQPLRIVFVKSPEAKARLKPALAPANVDKTMAAPVTAIFAHDVTFHDNFPETFPIHDMRPLFAGNPQLAHDTAFRNGSLQSAYMIIAARALGFDCGAMSGFDNAMVDREFFAGSEIKSNFLCNIGHRAGDAPWPRLPRLDFDRTCQIL